MVDVLSTNLSEYHGNFLPDKYIGSIGGQLQQMYYVIEQICNKFPNGLKLYEEKKAAEHPDIAYFERPNNLRELVLIEHLRPLFVLYLKAMKNEAIELFLHPICQKFLEDREVNYEDLSGLSEEDYFTFKTIMK